MRLPRLSLPRLSFGWLGFLGDRMTWLYITYTTTLFVVFLVLTFPHDLVVRRALSTINRGPMGIQFTKAGFAWHKGYEVAGIRIAPLEADGAAPLFETSRLWVRPLFGELFRGNPYALAVTAELYGGSLIGDLAFKDGTLSGTVNWSDLSLSKYRALTSQIDEGQIAGKVSGQVDFEARGANFAQGQATGEVTIDGIALTQVKAGGWPIPDLKLKQTKSKFKVGGGRLELQDFVANGDVSVQGSGHILLKEDIGESVLNLRATIAATPQTPDGLKAAIALIPRPVGAKPDAPVTITGTLSKPRLR